MMRQTPAHGIAKKRVKTQTELLQEAADIEELRAAYQAVLNTARSCNVQGLEIKKTATLKSQATSVVKGFPFFEVELNGPVKRLSRAQHRELNSKTGEPQIAEPGSAILPNTRFQPMMDITRDTIRETVMETLNPVVSALEEKWSRLQFSFGATPATATVFGAVQGAGIKHQKQTTHSPISPAWYELEKSDTTEPASLIQPIIQQGKQVVSNALHLDQLFPKSAEKPADTQSTSIHNGALFQKSARKTKQDKSISLQEISGDKMAAKTDADDPSEVEAFMGLAASPTPLFVRIFSQPKLVGSLISLFILASGAYACAGYWWMTSQTQSAPEPFALLQWHEAKPGVNKATQKSALPFSENSLLAQAFAPMEENIVPAVSQLRESEPEPLGRPDPFSPLVNVSNPMGGGIFQEEAKRDVLDDLQFTGFIGDIDSKDKIAMIRITNPVSGSFKTLIKKAGDSFMVDGERVTLKSVAKDGVQLSSGGRNRRLALTPYQSLASSSSKAKSSTAPAGNATAPASGNGQFSNINAVSNSGGKSAVNPELEEPN